MRNFIQFGADFHDPSRLADLAASLTSGEGQELQRVLEEVRVPERVEASLVLLRKEANLLKLQQDIGALYCWGSLLFGLRSPPHTHTHTHPPPQASAWKKRSARISGGTS